MMVVMTMDLAQLGEFALIDRIKEDTIYKADNVVVGIGDDAAVLTTPDTMFQLVTTDMLVEKVHFDLATCSAWELGYKAIAVNASDIAAMGGIPRHALVSIALPKDIAVDFVVSLYDGMKALCKEFSINIVGGDTVASPHGLIINVTLIGEVEPERLQRRSGARVGELIAVTGTLGDSACGLELLMRGNWEEYSFAHALVTKHRMPRPQVKAGRLLAALGSRSMNDISDGLASELHEIASASKVGMRVYSKKIPLSPEMQAAAALLGKEPIEYALYGGEDYQLVFTISPEAFAALGEVEIDNRITIIGEVTTESLGVLLVTDDDNTLPLVAKGYNHFR